jgi:hypothetical protein
MENGSAAIENDEYYEITQTNTQKIMKNIKNRKAPGINGITNEMPKCEGPEIQTEITILFRKIINTGHTNRNNIAGIENINNNTNFQERTEKT